MVRLAFTESTVEDTACALLERLGWAVKHGPEVAPQRQWLFAERADYGEVVLARRFRDALLPKLISGELRVRDTEEFLKEEGL
jgi:hypothetical protein